MLMPDGRPNGVQGARHLNYAPTLQCNENGLLGVITPARGNRGVEMVQVTRMGER